MTYISISKSIALLVFYTHFLERYILEDSTLFDYSVSMQVCQQPWFQWSHLKGEKQVARNIECKGKQRILHLVDSSLHVPFVSWGRHISFFLPCLMSKL